MDVGTCGSISEPQCRNMRIQDSLAFLTPVILGENRSENDQQRTEACGINPRTAFVRVADKQEGDTVACFHEEEDRKGKEKKITRISPEPEEEKGSD